MIEDLGTRLDFEDCSITYFNHVALFEAPYCWTFTVGGAHMQYLKFERNLKWKGSNIWSSTRGIAAQIGNDKLCYWPSEWCAVQEMTSHSHNKFAICTAQCSNALSQMSNPCSSLPKPVFITAQTCFITAQTRVHHCPNPCSSLPKSVFITAQTCVHHCPNLFYHCPITIHHCLFGQWHPYLDTTHLHFYRSIR